MAALGINATCVFAGTTFTEVVAVRVDRGGEPIYHSAGADTFITYQSLQKKLTTVVLVTDSTTALTIARGTSGTLTVTIPPASGVLTTTITGTAMLMNTQGGSAHASVDSNITLTFTAVSTDGSTEPIAITQA